jgi:hypothetical protein
MFGGVADIARLEQDPNRTPWDYIGAGVKVGKNVIDMILVLGNIIYITDFYLNNINDTVEMAKNKDTNWVDWTRYGAGKVMDILTFILGVGQLLSFIGSSMDF